MSTLVKNHRCDFEIDLLVCGYFKQVYDKPIPNEINKLCILLHGRDPFEWIVEKSEFGSIGRGGQMGYHTASSLSQKIESKIFSFQQIQFQLTIKKSHSGSLEILLNLLSKHVKVSGTTHIICQKPYYEFKKYFLFRFFSDKVKISQHYNDDNSPTFFVPTTREPYRQQHMNAYFGPQSTPHQATDTTNIIQTERKTDDEKQIAFLCYINILSIELRNTSIDKAINIKPYCKKIKYKQNVIHKWELKDTKPTIVQRTRDTSLLPIMTYDDDECSKRIFYCSPNFDNGNWSVRYIEEDNKCKACLQLIAKPETLTSVKWTLIVNYNDVSNTYESIANFHVRYDQHLQYWSGLVYQNENFWIKEYDTKSLTLISKIETIHVATQRGNVDLRTSMLEFEMIQVKKAIKEMSNKEEINKELLKSLKNKIDGTNEKGEKDEKVIVQKWLASIKLPQYFNTFVANGYESLDFIKEISNKTELLEIGIELKGHQTKLMAEIKKLSYM